MKKLHCDRCWNIDGEMGDFGKRFKVTMVADSSNHRPLCKGCAKLEKIDAMTNEERVAHCKIKKVEEKNG